VRHLRIAVIGTGFGGIGTTIRLAAAGFDDITVFEKSDDVGGVWRDNTYPGAACDVPSHLYSFSFAPKTDWSRRYAGQSEILGYLREIADRYDVRRRVRFSTEVLRASWTGDQWELQLSDGSTSAADLLVSACGQLSQPAQSELPGLDTFQGAAFHSAHWNHELDLAGRTVAVLGTGASAIQFVPAIAGTAGSVTVFQRSAPYVLPKRDPAYRPATVQAFAAAPALVKASRLGIYCYNESRSLGFNNNPKLLTPVQQRFRKMLAGAVPDPALRAAVTPTERMGCKRILVSNDWYAALQRPNVSLVQGAVVAVRSHGVVDGDGVEHPADTIIFGTGFRATDFLMPMQVRGAGGQELSQVWRDGASAHLGLTVPGFPNLFLVYGPNTNLGHNSVLLMVESQIGYVVQAARRLAAGDVRAMQVRPEVHSAFDAQVQRRSGRTVFADGCHSWYRTANGRHTQNWPGSTLTYRWRTRRLREADFALDPVRG